MIPPAHSFVSGIKRMDRAVGAMKLTAGIEHDGLAILLLHAVTESEKIQSDLLPGQALSVGMIRECIGYFLAAGYRFVVPRDLAGGLQEGKNVMLTFDDGYANNELVLPLLSEFKVPACFFLSTGFILSGHGFWWDILYRERCKQSASMESIRAELASMKKLTVRERDAYMLKEFGEKALRETSESSRPFTEEEVRTLGKNPLVELGNHTIDHALLTMESPEEVRRQIRGCQEHLEHMTGQSVGCISYPNGYCSDSVITIAGEEGLTSGITTKTGKNRVPLNTRSMMRLQRFPLSPDKNIASQCRTMRQDSLLNRAAAPHRKRLRILVTDSQELAGMGAVRSLGRAGHEVTAAHLSGVHPAVRHSRFCARTVSYPDPWQRHGKFRDWIKKELESGRYDAVLPVAEAAVVAVAALRPSLPSSVIAMLPSDGNLRFALSKYHAAQAAIDAGIPVAKTVFIHDGTNGSPWNDDLTSLRFPVVIKTDNVFVDGVYLKGKHTVVRSSAEANDVLTQCKALGCAVIAQEFIPGRGRGVAMLRWKNATVLRFAYRRLHEVPWTGGASSLRESKKDPQTEEYAEKFLKHIGYEGTAMVEFRQEHDNISPYFLEINGRMWGSIALALHVGFDFPAALADCSATGFVHPKRAQTSCRDGILCRNVYPGDVRWLFSVLKAKPKIGLPQPPSKIGACAEFFFLCLNPFIRYDFFWWTDPLPAAWEWLVMMDDLRHGLTYNLRNFLRARKERALLAEAKHTHEQKMQSGAPYFPPSVKTILFVCHGNIARSPFAEHLWNERRKNGLPTAISAGTLEVHGRPTPVTLQPLMKDFGVDLATHRSRTITKVMVDEADVIVVMDRGNARAVREAFPSAQSKLLFLGLFSGEKEIEIIDPIKLSAPEVRSVFQKIQRSVDGLIAALEKH